MSQQVAGVFSNSIRLSDYNLSGNYAVRIVGCRMSYKCVMSCLIDSDRTVHPLHPRMHAHKLLKCMVFIDMAI